MARVKGGLFTSTLDVSKRFPLDSRMLVSKKEDLINPSVWLTNTLTTESTYDRMIVSVNGDGNNNGVYVLTDRKAITEENYNAYKTTLNSGGDTSNYFSMWTKLLDGVELQEALKQYATYEQVGENFNQSVIGLTVTGSTITYVTGDGETHVLYDQDVNTDYFLATDEKSGMTKLYRTVGYNEDGTMTQKAIMDALNKKVSVNIDASTNALIFTTLTE